MLVPAALALLALGFGAGRLGRARPAAPAAPPATRFAVEVPLERRTLHDGVDDVALAPDGRALAFSAHGSREGILLRELDALAPVLLPGTAGAASLCFSPDGQWIAYHDRDAERLMRVPRAGGRPIPIAAAPSANGIAWSADGRLATSLDWGVGLSAVRVADGTLAPLAPFRPEDGERNHLDPTFLAGTSVVLYGAWTGGRWDDSLLVAWDAASGVRTELPVRGIAPRVVPLPGGGSALCWVRGDALWAARFDPRTLGCGDPQVVLEGVEVAGGSGRAKLAVSADGTLAYVPGAIDFGRPCRVVWVARDGREEPALPETGIYQNPSLSADGKRLALAARGPIFYELAVDLDLPLAERRPRRLTLENDSYHGLLTPDGAQVVYMSNPVGDYRIYRRPLDGGAEVEVVRSSGVPRCVSPDGAWLVYGERGDLWLAPLDASAPPRALVATPGAEWDAQISPDGRWLAYVAQDLADVGEVTVVSFPDGGAKQQVTRGGGSYPRWSSDGSELTYLHDGALMALPVRGGAALAFGAPQRLFASDHGVDESFGRDYCVAPDGRFLMLEAELPPEDRLLVVVVQGFAAELERRLPALGEGSADGARPHPHGTTR